MERRDNNLNRDRDLNRDNAANRDRDLNRSSNRDKHLFRLGELDDYKVASDDPDVRGWAIVDRDNREFGKINELIVDPDREKVRYLDVVSRGDNATPNEDHILIPIGAARINDNDNRVIVREIDSKGLGSYPVHRGNEITRDHEHEVVERFNRPQGTASATDRDGRSDFYNSEIYNEDNFYANRNRNPRS